ncbi:putative bifunctional diguanylate cyclase/phosphodiesterase [Comamonas jiangduensis]|uniref:putative bifunctional diguanylate cyclase/phosphodiesterase n=1 Tax=Comamonas jiangduensis TaxID=1194168 RepID=UPI0028ABC39E|nr:EAL domain-containing protein [Comamonas jiangduensis]
MLVAVIVLVLSLLWWLTAKHLRAQQEQVENATRLQQAGVAAIVSENLRQILEKAQLMSVLALQGVQGTGPWQHQLAQMLDRDRVFLRYTLLDQQLQPLAGDVQNLARWDDALAQQQGACAGGRGALVLPGAHQSSSQELTWQVPLLLCVTDAQGVSQGYLMLHMDLGYFLSLYQDVDWGASGSLHLLAPDGRVIAAMVGGGLVAQPSSAAVDAFRKVPEGAGVRNFEWPQGVARLANFHRTAHMPITVVVSREWREILAAHDDYAHRAWWLLSVVSVLTMGATLFLLRTLQRRQQWFDALEKADQDKQELIAQLESEKQRALALAASDHLTGLHNRRMFYELVSSHLALARRSSKYYALLYLDLDRFKSVNDTLGHHVGDALLQAVALRLQGMLRSSDIIARMGGDEFAVLVTAMEGPQDMDVLAQKLVEGLSAPYEGIAPTALHTSPSIGIAFFPRDGHDVEVLCRHADTAMYASKKAGRNRFTYYERITPVDSERGYRLARQLPDAIAQEQLVLHFQPKVRLEDRNIVGFEALVRWQHPELGLIYPGDFIALAEEHGHIEALGEWVMLACCRQIAAWRMQGLDVRPIAFNVSPLQLRDCAFPLRLATCLQHYGVRGSDVEVEITESCLVEPVGVATRVLSQLQQMGVRIGLDDFGTGFSSLSQIRSLPIDTIKLDKSFVNELRSSKEAGVLVTSIITLAHNLKMQVVAEGVELMDQLVYLKTAGCDVAQGYFLSRPVTAQNAEALLRQSILEIA